jgi:hypothetical protein
MKAHSHKVIAQSARIHAVVEPLEPTVACLVVEDLMFRAAGIALLGPAAKEIGFVKDLICICGPFSERLASGTVNDRQAAQLPELLRELWDFR